MEFRCDPLKRAKVLAERAIDLHAVGAIFFGRYIAWEDRRRDYGETRMIAVGCIEKDFITVVYTDRDDVRWIVTAWPSNRKERAAWHASP
ncbi:BrnT family toxin [Methylobacterium sp. sgz302541]|uniref:BrnT family toxin n=1 Tax=unclassified Methylobacterium TaxID=2615210 RepID=UPI003D327474